MSTTHIDGILLQQMIIGGCNKISKNRDLLNDLNVFPVPDGDTGSNMYMTIFSAAQAIEKINTKNIYEVAKKASDSALSGARGNSGVILSQLFRGIVKGVSEKEYATIEDISLSFSKSYEAAYNAVITPKEGTILTIAREISEKTFELSKTETDIIKLFSKIIEHGNNMLNKTTEMLPALKEANVVDSGGKGLMLILEGAYEALVSDSIFLLEAYNDNLYVNSEENFVNINDLAFKYCTELFIEKDNVIESDEINFKNFLSDYGDSIVYVDDEKNVKLHIHTNNPGIVLEKALTLGQAYNIKIEDMHKQHSSLITQKENSVGYIAVSSGNGISEVLKEIGIDKIINGGQSFNPSTADFINAINGLNTDTVFIFPNNKNIILTANQVAKIVKNKKVYVIPTKSFTECISTMLNFSTNVFENEIKNPSEVFNILMEGIENVLTGEITFAVKDSTVDSMEIAEGQIISILDGKITNVSSDIEDVGKNLLDSMLVDHFGFISIYYGQDILKEEAEKLKEYIETKYEDVEIDIRYGGQPLYYYIISAE